MPSSVLADIHDSFDIEDVELGSGSFSVVRPGFSKADGTKWAVKIINKKNVKNQVTLFPFPLLSVACDGLVFGG